MVKKINNIALIVLLLTIILLISYNQKSEPPEQRKTQQPYPALLEEDYIIPNDTHKHLMKDIILRQRFLIEQETKDYQFPIGTELKDYTISTNGKPIRSVIITTWRSGSTFLGDVLNSIPGNYYHYEPLLDYGIVQVRGPPHSDNALATLKRLLNCDYTDLEAYLNYGQSHEYLFTHNYRLWTQCEQANLCWNAKFLNDFCRLFPFQSMKVVRLRLKLAEEFLKDESLNVKVLLLVRDPRGTLQSRKHRDWCPGHPDCDNPNLLCADMVSDYNAAAQLLSKYPNTLRVVRYEDLSLNPYEMFHNLFEFFGLDFHANVRAFLDSHTKSNMGGVSSTFRDSKSAPFHWRMDLNATEVQYIEESCDEAMKLWGYARTKNDTILKEFDPLATYTIN